MRSTLLLAFLISAAWGQEVSGGFVENAAGVGLLHSFQSGLDKVGKSLVRDFIQAGMSLGDIDGDGDLDVVACGGLAPNTVFRNDGGSFTDVTSLSPDVNVGEYDRVAALGDHDGDGDLDLFLGACEWGDGDKPGRGRFYRNDGTGVFTDVTAAATVTGSGHTTFAQWGDLDMDGLLDLYVSEFHGGTNTWYRNNGDGGFTERASALGIAGTGNTHVSAIGDTDQDGLPELFLANDWAVGVIGPTVTNQPDKHLHGQASHVYADVSVGSGFDQYSGVMGLAFGDVDYDGDLDVYKADVKNNWMLINHGWPGGAVWEDQAPFYGIVNDQVENPVSQTLVGKSVGWAVVFMNADFDPWLDLFVVNGKVSGPDPNVPYAPSDQPNFLFHGDGPAGQFAFTDLSDAFGLVHDVDDRGAAVGDLDGDGDLDILVSPIFGPLRYYENQVDRQGQGWLRVRADCKTSAPGGFGVLARYTDSLGYPHLRLIGGDGPTASQHDNAAYFTIGNELAVDVTVEFPSGIVQTYPAIAANSELVAVEPELIRLPARTVPILAAPGSGLATTAILAGSPPASSLYEVTVFAHDATGVPLDGTAVVTIDMPGLAPFGPVEHQTGAEFRRTFRAPGKPGSFRVRASFDGFQVRIEPQVHFYDPRDVSGTTVRVQPEAVRAGSADTFRVLVSPRTAGGILTGSEDVTVDVPGATALGPPTLLSEGIVMAEFQAPAAPGAHPIAVLVDGQPVAGAGGPPGPLVVEAGGLADGQQSVFHFEEPVAVQVPAPHQMKLSVSVRDAGGYRLGPWADVVMTATADPGTPDVTVFPVHTAGQRDGDRAFILEKPPGTPDGGATGWFHSTIDGFVMASFPYAF